MKQLNFLDRNPVSLKKVSDLRCFMELPLLRLVLLTIGLVFVIHFLPVYSQEDGGNDFFSPSIEPPPPPPTRPPPSRRSSHSPPPRHHKRHRPPPPPPPSDHKLNAGEKIGLLFAGIIIILQIGVVSFLVFKRRQLLK